jgi:sugar/nucleoside kinase (ribokinase family)
VVGAATRDKVAAEPRGWRLGGAAAYASLAAARLGAAVTCYLGVDGAIEAAGVLDPLRGAGVDLVLVRLSGVPEFENREEATGRRQWQLAPGSPLPPPERALERQAADAASAWLFAPVAGEIGPAWVALPASEAIVALGLQGWLRRPGADGRVGTGGEVPAAFRGRADVAALSHEDASRTTPLAALRELSRRGATTLLTVGARGGLAMVGSRFVAWPALRPAVVVDPTGAGDVFLGAYVAAILASPYGAGDRRALRIAAAAASCSVEAPGLAGVPTLAAVRARARGSA